MVIDDWCWPLPLCLSLSPAVRTRLHHALMSWQSQLCSYHSLQPCMFELLCPDSPSLPACSLCSCAQVVDLEWKRQQEAEKPKSDQEKVSKSCHVAEKADNQPRNRYFDVLPFDATRVRLQQGNDYINANMLRSRQTEVPSWQFIVTQVSCCAYSGLCLAAN